VRELLLIGLTVLGMAGCGTLPFREVELVPLGDVEPETVRGEFAQALPAQFLIVNSVAFHFKGRVFSAIGYTDVDTSTGKFTVVGLHPAGGLKLFEVSGNSEDAECSFALEEFGRWGDLAEAVAEDTRRMYFDRVPAPDAEVSREKYRILFRQRAAEGELEYVFAGAGPTLVEKRYYAQGARLWSASYYEYRREGGKLYPRGIILRDHARGYRLVLRLREIRP